MGTGTWCPVCRRGVRGHEGMTFVTFTNPVITVIPTRTDIVGVNSIVKSHASHKGTGAGPGLTSD